MKIMRRHMLTALLVGALAVLPSLSYAQQVAFYAFSTSPIQNLPPGATQVVMPVVSFNIGTGYDTSTSLFTAPLDGVYQFNASASIDTGSGAPKCVAFILSVFVNGVERQRLQRYDSAGGQFQLSGSTVLQLTQDAVVDMRVFHNCASSVAVEIEPGGGAFFNGASFF